MQISMFNGGAGNSIVVPVLEAIFKNLLAERQEVKE